MIFSTIEQLNQLQIQEEAKKKAKKPEEEENSKDANAPTKFFPTVGEWHHFVLSGLLQILFEKNSTLNE
ncbi:MAG TPA: hypothetical protein DCF68_03395 [Cyanothece sp. UBA12306]|nr:hypothetical protein [Cyanothece sp. UBA12306]